MVNFTAALPHASCQIPHVRRMPPCRPLKGQRGTHRRAEAGAHGVQSEEVVEQGDEEAVGDGGYGSLDIEAEDGIDVAEQGFGHGKDGHD